ncbi:hypothetical protein Tco_0255994 [Tanacetum coccineum]
MESSNSNSKERELQLTQRLSKQRHSICMTWFEQLETHLHVLYLLNSPYVVDAFKPAFYSFFGDEHQTFKLKMFHNLAGFLASKGVNATDLLNQGWQQDFEDFTRCEPSAYRRDLLENLDTLEAVIHRAVITFGRLQLQSQDAQINPVQAVDDNVKALNAGVDIRLVNDQVPFAEVQLTTQHNVLANEQQHTEQSEPIYDTYLLEKVDSNTTPDSTTNSGHKGEERLTRMLNMIKFLQLEKHCISLEISIQQKEESFQSNKPCKNQDSPEFREFFEINELKAQLQAKNSTINNLKEQIKNVHEKSNEAKVKHDIDVIETINIELEHKVAKLLQENEHLKQTYKELYDSIKKTRIQTKDHNDSLIAQVNSTSNSSAGVPRKVQDLNEHSSNDVWTKQFKPRSSSYDVCSHQFRPRSSTMDVLRVARLEQEMSEVKKTDHSADVLASIKFLNPIKNQESEKSPKEIIRIKREQGEEKQDSTYSIRNPANYHLYHALMEALIADEDAMDKEVAVKDQTRVGQQREKDPNLSLLGQLSLLRKMITKVQRNHGSLMHCSNTSRSLTHYLMQYAESNPSYTKKDIWYYKLLTTCGIRGCWHHESLLGKQEKSKRQPELEASNERNSVWVTQFVPWTIFLLQEVQENEVFQDLHLIQKLRDDQNCLKKVVPSSRSKATKDIISIGSFVKVLVLNQCLESLGGGSLRDVYYRLLQRTE